MISELQESERKMCTLSSKPLNLPSLAQGRREPAWAPGQNIIRGPLGQPQTFKK